MPDNSGNWWDSAPELPDYYAFLPEHEQAMGPKERSLAALTHMGTFGYLPYWRADQAAEGRGEGDKGRGTPQYEAQRRALQQFYNETWENAPDSVKVLSVAGLPGGLSPAGAVMKGLGSAERPILTGSGIGAAGAGAWGYNAPQEPASDDWQTRLQSALEAVPYGVAFGAAAGAAAHAYPKAPPSQADIDAFIGSMRPPPVDSPDRPFYDWMHAYEREGKQPLLPPAGEEIRPPQEPPAPSPEPPISPATPPSAPPSAGGAFDALDLVAPKPSDVKARPPRAAPAPVTPAPVEPEVPHVPGPDLFAPPIPMPAVEAAPEIAPSPPQTSAPWLTRPDVQQIPPEWTSGDAWWASSPIVSETPPAPSAAIVPPAAPAAPETPVAAPWQAEALPAPIAEPIPEQPASPPAVAPQTPIAPEPVSEADPYALIGGPTEPAPSAAPAPGPVPATAEPPSPLAGQYPHHTLTPQTEKGVNPDLYDQLHQSMQTRTPVEFMHEGLPRIGSIHRIGQITTKPGDETRIQMYQTGGKSSHPLPGWRFFNVGPAGGKGKAIEPGSLKLNPEGHAWRTHGDYLNPNTGGFAQQVGIRNVHAEIPHEEIRGHLGTPGEQGGAAPSPALETERQPQQATPDAFEQAGEKWRHHFSRAGREDLATKAGFGKDAWRISNTLWHQLSPERQARLAAAMASELEVAPVPQSAPSPDFASTVNSLLGGSEKMPISQVYDEGVAKGFGQTFGSLDDFKRKLADAAKEGSIDLERHDIAGGIDKRSETPFGRDVRHYVVNPKAAPAPIVDHEKSGTQPNFASAVYETAITTNPAVRGPDGRGWRIKKEDTRFGDGYIVLRMPEKRGDVPQYFRPDEGRAWTRDFASMRAAELAKQFAEAEGVAKPVAPSTSAPSTPSPFDLIAPKPTSAPQEQETKPVIPAPVEKMPGTVIDSKGREWRPIGKNADGVDLFEDQRGVRSYVSDGIRHTEPVSINPRGGISTNREIHTEYEVASPPQTEKPAEQPAAPATPRDAFVSAVKDKLAAGERPFRTIVDARKLAKEHDLEFPEGESANKHVDELVERAVVETARGIVDKARSEKAPAADTFAKMVALYENQPNLSTRTSASVAEQAYSTPAPLAYVASRLADIGPSTHVLEPTAGNGMLLMEANPKKTVANELNPTRAKSLEEQGFQPTKDDAAEEATFAPRAGQMDAVIANPPFGAVRVGGQSKVFQVGDYKTTQIDHAIALNALRAMKADGRAVLIIGGVKAETPQERAEGYGQKTKRRFFHQLLNNYKVSDIFTVSGDLYAKQGAGWPVDVIVIDGKGETDMVPLTKQPPPLLKSWDEVGAKLNEARPAQVDTGAAVAPGQDSESSRAPFDGERQPTSGNEVGGGKASGSGPVQREPEPEKPAPVGGGSADTEPGHSGPKPSVDKGTGSAPREGRDVRGTDLKPHSEGKRALEEAGAQSPYEPASQKGVKLNTLSPANLRDATEESLARLQREHGDIDNYVSESLGYPVDENGMYFIGGDGKKNRPFSAEQIDAIGLGISNIQKGEGFIIGDQTGIGKGRVVAAMISYAKRQGLVPIFVTEKPDLYGDMWRDLHDIGWDKQLGRPIGMMMTNSNTRVPLDDAALEWIAERDEAKASGQPIPPQRGAFSPSQSTTKANEAMRAVANGEMTPDVVFTTYDQMNSVKGSETPRRNFLRAVSPRSFLIMDESHNAGGSATGNEGWSSTNKASPRSEVFREAVGRARSVMYSSATYAKSPHVMTLYSKTDMAKAVSDPKLLPELIVRGGVPLQQVVAAMLSKAGQYIRRERSFEGVSYDHENVPVNEDAYAEFTNGLRSVFEFDRSFEKERDKLAKRAASEMFGGSARDAGVGEASASSTAFSSLMHNVISQMVMAMKAKQAGERAVQALKAGEKPVIALSKTNASFIKDFSEAAGLAVGDTANINFADILRRYLERTRRVTLKRGDDEKVHHVIPLSDMSPEAVSMYHAAEDALRDIDVGDLPVSPIDAIRHEIQKAGHSVREITGRDEMLDYSGDQPVIVKRPASEIGSTGKAMTKKLFNNGGVDAVILNRSGSTGISLHASSGFKDQRRRRMIIAEADPNIDTHMQMLGRVHRTGQVIPPAYTHMSADIPAEVRPTAVLMRKMASLNANTTGAAKSKFSSEAVDFLNKYGDQVAHDIMASDPETSLKLGDPIDTSGDVAPGSAAKVTGRLTLLTPVEQQSLLDRITGDYKSLIEALDAAGENDLEAKHLDLQAKVLSSKPLKAASGPSPFQGGVDLEKVSIKSQGRALGPDEVSSRVAEVLKSKEGGAEFVHDMPRLEREGKAKQDRLIEETRVKAADQMRKAIGGLKSPEAKKRAEEKANGDWLKWRDLATMAHPGAKVTLRVGGEDVPAIGIGFTQKQTAKNPLALSSWEALFALPNSSRTLGVPLSRLKQNAGADEKGVVGIKGGASVSFADLADMFEKARKEGREDRYMITGNLLAGLDQTRGSGQIITHTMEDGTVRPAILMPKQFKEKDFFENRAIRFENGEHVLKFLDAAKNGEVKSADDVISISHANGRYAFEMPAARATGGKYYADRTVRDVFDNWEKRGGKMMAVLSRDRADKLIDALRNVGATFETKSEQDLATSTAAEKTPPMPGKQADASASIRPIPSQYARSFDLVTPKSDNPLFDVISRNRGIA